MLTLAEVKRRHVEYAMAQCGGNKVKAAQALGIGRRSLYRYLAKYKAEDARLGTTAAAEVTYPVDANGAPVGNYDGTGW